MRFRLGLAIGFGVGYVLGTKAGHEQYERITGATKQLWESGAGRQIKDVAEQVAEQVGARAAEAVEAVQERIEAPVPEAPASTEGDGSNGKL